MIFKVLVIENCLYIFRPSQFKFLLLSYTVLNNKYEKKKKVGRGRHTALRDIKLVGILP